MQPLDKQQAVKYYSFYTPNTIWLLKNKENVMEIKDKIVRKEYKKFLRNPPKRLHKKLWISLSNIFIKSIGV